jgi:hypothetical protein
MFDDFLNQYKKQTQNLDEHYSENAKSAIKYEDLYGGYGRQSRDAKGYESAMDWAMRYPNQSIANRILAGGYQGLQTVGNEVASLFTDPLQGNFNPISRFKRQGQEVYDQYKDFLANISGIEAGEKISKEAPKGQRVRGRPYTEERMQQEAMNYADPYVNMVPLKEMADPSALQYFDPFGDTIK